MGRRLVDRALLLSVFLFGGFFGVVSVGGIGREKERKKLRGGGEEGRRGGEKGRRGGERDFY